MTTFTEDQLAARFGVTVQQVRAMHADNGRALRRMLAKALQTGKKVNGYSAQKLRKMVADTEMLAQGVFPQS